MSEVSQSGEDYLTKSNPTLEDWHAFNEPIFETIQAVGADGTLHDLIRATHGFAPLVDADIKAEKLGISPSELLTKAEALAGDLGKLSLGLVDSEMDGAQHIVLKLPPLETES